MRLIPATEVEAALAFPPLVDALKAQFRQGGEMPLRQHYAIQLPESPAGMLLTMPAWSADGYAGVKLVSVYPENPRLGLPSIMGTYILMDARTGEPLATMDGGALTVWRTAAASALAAQFLARPESKRLLIVGAGRLAPYVAKAYADVIGIESVLVWGRRLARARDVAKSLTAGGLSAEAIEDLETAVRAADIVSCVTMSQTPLIRGAWLAPGVHLDLIGGYTPAMRECDDEAVRRARVYVDTREGALKEAGDLIQPIQSGAFRADSVIGDLFDLCRGQVAGRRGADEITLFKSVGCALEDLAGAQLVYNAARS